MNNNGIDANEHLNRKRKFDQFLDGICHSREYKAARFKVNEYPIDGTVWIDIYAGNEPALNICFEDDSRIITMTREEAVQLAKDIFSSIE